MHGIQHLIHGEDKFKNSIHKTLNFSDKLIPLGVFCNKKVGKSVAGRGTQRLNHGKAKHCVYYIKNLGQCYIRLYVVSYFGQEQWTRNKCYEIIKWSTCNMLLYSKLLYMCYY